MADTVSPMITDAVAPAQTRGSSMSDSIIETHEPTNLQVLGVSRSQALAVAYQSLAQSLSMLMLNAVAAQQAAATVNTAIVTLTVKRLYAGQDPQTSTENNANA